MVASYPIGSRGSSAESFLDVYEGKKSASKPSNNTYLVTQYRRWVSLAKADVSNRSNLIRSPSPSNNEMPSPSSTGTTSCTISSTRPGSRHCREMLPAELIPLTIKVLGKLRNRSFRTVLLRGLRKATQFTIVASIHQPICTHIQLCCPTKLHI